MAAQFKIGRKFQIVFRPSTTLLKIVVIVLIVFSTAALIALSWVRQSIQVQTEDLRQEAMALEQENRDLENKIGILGSVQSVEEIAQEELGMVKPNTIIINPNSHSNGGSKKTSGVNRWSRSGRQNQVYHQFRSLCVPARK